MKRAASFILLFVYFTVTTGFSVNLHYCMDEYQSWELGSGGDAACTVCGMDTGDSAGCCRDEVKLVKLHDDDFDTYTVSLKLKLPEAPKLFFLSHSPFESPRVLAVKPAQPDPDTGPAQPIYLRNRVFRI
jgi:hypothetical protein